MGQLAGYNSSQGMERISRSQSHGDVTKITCLWVTSALNGCYRVLLGLSPESHQTQSRPHSPEGHITTQRKSSMKSCGDYWRMLPEVRSSGSVNGRHIYSSARPIMSRPSAKTEKLLQ